MAYNKRYPPGQETVLNEGGGGGCRGYIRVSLNLRRPIHVAAGTKPPSIYNLTSSTLTYNNKTLTSFYLPQDTIRALHLTSLTSVYDVIRALLNKFRVVDNPHKFALYEKFEKPTSDGASVYEGDDELGRQHMRKMADEEKPLLLALGRCLASDEPEAETDIGPPTVSATDSGATTSEECCYFVLQENDPGEICWESFTFPELKNFLLILHDRKDISFVQMTRTSSGF